MFKMYKMYKTYKMYKIIESLLESKDVEELPRQSVCRRDSYVWETVWSA